MFDRDRMKIPYLEPSYRLPKRLAGYYIGLQQKKFKELQMTFFYLENSFLKTVVLSSSFKFESNWKSLSPIGKIANNSCFLELFLFVTLYAM